MVNGCLHTISEGCDVYLIRTFFFLLECRLIGRLRLMVVSFMSQMMGCPDVGNYRSDTPYGVILIVTK